MLGSFKKKISDIKQNIKQQRAELNLRRLPANVFPYSCLVADDVMLTKNGEVLQIIEIVLDDFKQNQEGGLRDAIRKAIAENTTDLKTAFWIQTVKKKRNRKQLSGGNIKNYFLNKINDVCLSIESNLNNYTTSIYITVVKQGESFRLKPSYMKLYFSTILLDRQHDRFIDKSIESIHKLTNSITNVLSIYKPKILGARVRDGCEYSELIETLYFLINFEEKQVPIKPVDASSIINDSEYLFENGIMAMRNDSKKTMRLGMSFSLKEVPRIQMSNVSDVINNTRAEMIITEYVSYVDQKFAMSKFEKQKGFLMKREDKKFQNEVGLGFLDGNADTKYCQSSISITLFASNTTELKDFVVECTNMFSKHGVVMAREDISLERNYYAMMPANFAFTHRLTIHDASEVGCFCYSYTPQENDASCFFNNDILFNIGTLKGNAVPIGIDKSKKNTLIGGGLSSGKTVLANFIASTIMRDFDANLYMISLNNRSSVYIDSIGGTNYYASLNANKHNAFFNGINIDFFSTDKEKEEYLFNVFSLLLGAMNVIITPKIISEIQQVIAVLVRARAISNKIALHDIRDILRDKTIDNELQSWHSIGRYYHLFDNRSDVFDNSNILSVNIDDTITSKPLILTAVVNHIMNNVIQRAKRSKKLTIVILDEPFVLFGDSFYKTKLSQMIKEMEENNICCIFKASDITSANSSIVIFTDLIKSCGLQIHFANKLADANYGNVFELEKMQSMAIKTLSMYEGRTMLIQQQNAVYSCKFELDNHKKMLNLLSDKGETRERILTIKDALQTNNSQRWLPAYFDDVFSENENIEERMAMEKELQNIKDIKRLLEG